MLREGWNFHDDIAVKLEAMAARDLKSINRNVKRVYDAEVIEQGRFIEVMLVLLMERVLKVSIHEEIDQFARDCRPYAGLNVNVIPKEEVQRLFNTFLKLYEE